MRKPTLTLLTLLTLGVFDLIDSYRILLVSPSPSKSHVILTDALVRYLTQAGHEITYITTSPVDIPRVNVVDISDISSISDAFHHTKDIMDKKLEINEITGMLPLILEGSKRVIENPNVQRLMADKTQQFDVIIAEFLFNTIYAGFSGLYNCPLIWFTPIYPTWMTLELVDEATNPAYSVGASSTNIPPLNFAQRVEELYSLVIRKLLQIFWTSRFDNDVYEKNFVPHIRERGNSVPSFESLAYNGSLVLSNYHPSINIPIRMPQNCIKIGGFHIDQDIKPLPENLQKLMDNANHGVIYFSMGSHMQSRLFPDNVKRELLEVFGKLKQTVLWKFEEDLPNRPSNVHIIKWAPQQSVLAHKNCIIFITHGGLLSTTETIHFGVPIIGIPAFYDQFVNVERSVKMGFAKKVDLSYTIAKDLEKAIQDMLRDPKYTNNAKELSKIYHDRTVPPGKELVHWVEHVVKTRGALHLRSPAFMVPWYQKIYLDFALFLVILYLVVRYSFQFMFRYSKTKLVNQGKQKKN